MTDLETLRTATEHDVARALDGAYVSLPLTDAAQVLEAFNRILDLKLGQGAGTDE